MFYTYHQNNSGGVYVIDENVTKYVIIEADTGEDVNKLAQKVGIYFDGVIDGLDCGCCGDRWYRFWDEYADEVPEVYGETDLQKVANEGFLMEDGEPTVIVYYLDGKKETFYKRG